MDGEADPAAGSARTCWGSVAVSGNPGIDVLAGVINGKVIMSLGPVSACFAIGELEKESPKAGVAREAVTGAGKPEGAAVFVVDRLLRAV